ncbi:hypothetical protein DL766_004719 [Monosporascus sp. MC13-8B]|nr:hypothetical protein DL766_004719 [Monosporascus sp. MC13-8B]
MVRTMTSEVVKEKRFAIILSALVAAWTVELKPAGQGSSFLRKYPYALPALLNATFLFMVLVTAFLFLEETSKSVRHRYDPGIAASRYILSLVRSFRRPVGGKGAQYLAVNTEEGDTEEMGFLDDTDHSSSPTSPEAPSKVRSEDQKLPMHRIFTNNMVLVLLASFIYESHLATASVAFPNLLVTPVSSREEELNRVLPFWFGGGAGFTPRPLAVYAVMYAGRVPEAGTAPGDFEGLAALLPWLPSALLHISIRSRRTVYYAAAQW